MNGAYCKSKLWKALLCNADRNLSVFFESMLYAMVVLAQSSPQVSIYIGRKGKQEVSKMTTELNCGVWSTLPKMSKSNRHTQCCYRSYPLQSREWCHSALFSSAASSIVFLEKREGSLVSPVWMKKKYVLLNEDWYVVRILTMAASRAGVIHRFSIWDIDGNHFCFRAI